VVPRLAGAQRLAAVRHGAEAPAHRPQTGLRDLPAAASRQPAILKPTTVDGGHAPCKFWTS
jgi:hypothetical protein